MKYLWIFIICCATNAVQAERKSANFCDTFDKDDLAVLVKFFSSNVNTIVSGIEEMRKRLDDLSEWQTEQGAQLSILLKTVTKLTRDRQLSKSLENASKPREKPKRPQQNCLYGDCFQTTLNDYDDVTDERIQSLEDSNELYSFFG